MIWMIIPVWHALNREAIWSFTIERLPFTIVPGENMPQWLEAIADFFPLSHFASAFIAGFSPIEDVSKIHWGDLAYMALWGVVGLGLAIRFFRWEAATGTSKVPWRRSKMAEVSS